MKPPPFLIFAALLFWGWQADFLIVGTSLGLVLESSRLIRARWDLDDADFNHIWSFCVLLVVVLAGYVFTNNDAGGGFGAMLHGNLAARNAVNSAVLTSTRFLRWLPMATFPFIFAQVFNLRPSVPLTAVSLVLRWRRRKGEATLAGHYLDIVYPYFIVCLFSAGIHSSTGSQSYFWGQCVLITWALWSVRARRFGIVAWACTLAAVLGVGFLGQFGISQAQRAIENFNAQWMARFFRHRTDAAQSVTSIGQIGDLKLSPTIVVWLQPEIVGQVPTYLREASYRKYNPQHQTWFAGSAANDFEPLSAEKDGTSWVLVPGGTNAASINIACYLNGWSSEYEAPEGLLPLPTGTRTLGKVPAQILLKKNPTGAVLAAGLGLVIFDAHYRLGTSIDSPPNLLTNFDSTVNLEEKAALDQVISEMKLTTNAALADKLIGLQRFFAQKFFYSTWQGRDKNVPTNGTPLSRFLLTHRTGHCEYFATATVLLLRELGVPARYAVGYAVHETSGTGFIVRERDAHAWCLAWDAATQTWVDVDTTPSSWMGIESQRKSIFEWLSDLKSWLGFELAKFRWREAQWQQYLFWSLIPVLVVLLYYIIFRHQKKRRDPDATKRRAATEIWPGLDSEFYQLEKMLAARGLPRPPGESLADWLQRALAEPALSGQRPPLQQLLQLHYRHRFDPPGLSAAQREQLKREASVCLAALARTPPAK